MAVIIAGGFLAVWAASPVKDHGPCKESMERCSKKCGSGSSDNMTWGTLPHRFFSSLSLD